MGRGEYMDMTKRIKIWKPETCNIAESVEIGDDVVIHSHVVIYEDVKIGDRVKIQSGVFIPNGIEIEDDVFIGPHTVFTNDRKPPSFGKDWEKTFVHHHASIGANVTILPGVTIGACSTIGAGAVVTKDVPPGVTVVGNPARPLNK